MKENNWAEGAVIPLGRKNTRQMSRNNDEEGQMRLVRIDTLWPTHAKEQKGKGQAFRQHATQKGKKGENRGTRKNTGRKG